MTTASLMRSTFQRITRDYMLDAPDDWEGHPFTEPFVLGLAMGRAAASVSQTEDEFMTALVLLLQVAPEEETND